MGVTASIGRSLSPEIILHVIYQHSNGCKLGPLGVVA